MGNYSITEKNIQDDHQKDFTIKRKKNNLVGTLCIALTRGEGLMLSIRRDGPVE